MAKFRFKGKQTISFTLPEAGDCILAEENKEYELPEENDYIKTLVASGYLEQVPTPRKKKEHK